MRRVYPKGTRFELASDYRPFELPDGRMVMLSGLEWCNNATPERRLQCALAKMAQEEGQL